MEKRDATWKSIKETISEIGDEIDSAYTHANDAQYAIDNASDQIKKLKQLLKIREEYDGQVSEPSFDPSDLANEFVKLIESKIKKKG